jgi:carboxypeptidase family protein/TonB-dependent receptor-like protein
MHQGRSVISRGACCLLLALLFSGLCSTTVRAQYRASVQGVVTDSQGAAIVGATIRLTSKETNRTQETKSGDGGFYRFDSLAPGGYSIAAEKSGFKKNLLENVLVEAEQTQGVNIQLNAGDVGETITISAEATEQRHTENPNIDGSITTREIQRLPQIGRDPLELVKLAPGVFGMGARDGTGGSVGFPNTQGPGGSNDQIFQTENRPSVTANGQRVEGNNIQIDGVTSMSQAWGGASVVTPNQESVKEVRVLANNYSAEYGRSGGAQILLVSQNGTNDYHGSFFFKRNTPGLNSEQNFAQEGTAILEGPRRVEQRLSQWGGSIGGPIRFPLFGLGGKRSFNGKDKLFFFFSYETIRRSSSNVSENWIETPEFVNLVKTTRPNSIASQILSFPGMTPSRAESFPNKGCPGTNPAVCQEVAGGLDVGGPNGVLDGIPDVRSANLIIPDNTIAQQFNPRIDYQVTKNDLVAFSMYFVPNKRDFNEAWGNRGRPGLDVNSSRRNTVGTLLWTRTISPTMVNEARFNVSRWYFNEVGSNPNVGWGIPQIRIEPPPDVMMGNIAVGGIFYQTTYNFRDTVSKIIGAHALKFGGDIISEQNNDRGTGRPTYNFDSLWDFANDHPIKESANFDPVTGAFSDAAAYARTGYYALFVQDDWKARQNLTLNLGLRWEYFTPLHSANNKISNLILGPNGSLLDSRLKTGGNLYNPDRNNFGPQLGFAWNPASYDKIVLRGGFGVGFNRLPGNKLLDLRNNAPVFASFDLTDTDIRYTLAGDINSFNYPANPAATLIIDPATNFPAEGAPVNINVIPQDAPNAYSYRYSLAAEYDVGAGWIASLAYQGSAARKLARTVPYDRLVTPNPRLGKVFAMLPDANSNFNALLAGASRRFSKGFLFNAEYRWSKSLDTCSNDADCKSTYPFDQSTEYGPSDFDARHAFKAYGVLALPFFNNSKSIVGKLAGGWELSGILTASSGFPWTPVVRSECTVGLTGKEECFLRPTAQIQAPTGSTSNDAFLGDGQFAGGGDTYFALPPSLGPDEAYRVPPQPGIGRNSFRGPGYFSIDMTAVKRFKLPAMRFLGESAGIEIRANAYNLFNRLNLKSFLPNEDNTRIDNDRFGKAIHALSGRVAEIQVRFSF